jgi:hypothetical protein
MEVIMDHIMTHIMDHIMTHIIVEIITIAEEAVVVVVDVGVEDPMIKKSND